MLELAIGDIDGTEAFLKEALEATSGVSVCA
jgi:hypothetical protein